MTTRTLSEWLAWQETLNPAEIDLGLERVEQVYRRLGLHPPEDRVFTVAGTNGKGSTAAAIDVLLRAAGLRPGLYSSPHLVRYNERVQLAGHCVSDAELVAAFEAVEAARGDLPLTYFEYGTLAALWCFEQAGCDAWVLEVGLGGRLDAVNVVDADVAVITTVDLDHQDWLGDSVELIAAEKAGVLRAGKPAFYGDQPVPVSVRARAADIGARLGVLGVDYSFEASADEAVWLWRGDSSTLQGLRVPPGNAAVQTQNQALALAAVEAADPALLADEDRLRTALGELRLPGRAQRYRDVHDWWFDVAHNEQAAKALAAGLAAELSVPTTVVAGMLADKQAESFARAMHDSGDRWITCPVSAARGSDSAALAQRLSAVLDVPVEAAASLEEALELARERTPPGGRIVVCGSFYVVGPALEWLGLY